MKKLYTLVAVALLSIPAVKGQDTLLFEDFETVRFYDTLLLDLGGPPPGNTTDMNWYMFDADGHADASGSGRPNGYFALYPFSDVDAYETMYSTPGAPDTNTVIGANSWTNLGDGNNEANYLITSNILLGSADTLFWKSAPRQTPRYLDGYQVLLSTTTNEDLAFTNVLFNAAEMVGAPGSDTTFSTFTFSPAGAFVHGQDGTYIDYAAGGNSHVGQLRQFSVPLNAYAGQNIFIAFKHNTSDDNLISFDDVMIRGTLPSSINEANVVANMSVYPNPAVDAANLTYTLKAETTVTISVIDITGKVVAVDARGTQAAGRHITSINTSELAKGFYTVVVTTETGRTTQKLIVK